MRLTINMLILVLVFGTSSLARAQAPETQTAPLRKWSYSFRVSISGRTTAGTFRQLVLASQLEMEISSQRWHFSNLATYRFNRTNGLRIEDDRYELATASCYVNGEKLFPTAFYSYDDNLMFRVQSRHLAGAGLSTQKTGAHSFLRLDLGGGYENTLFNGTDFENSDFVGAKREKALLLARVIHRHQLLKDRLSFSSTVFYRHSLKEGRDFFVRIAPSLSFKAAAGLSISANYLFRFENVHIKALSGSNSLLVFGLNYQIKTNE